MSNKINRNNWSFKMDDIDKVSSSCGEIVIKNNLDEIWKMYA